MHVPTQHTRAALGISVKSGQPLQLALTDLCVLFYLVTYQRGDPVITGCLERARRRLKSTGLLAG